MKQQDSARFLTNYEISDILQHIAAVVNSNPQKNDYLNNGETYTAVEGQSVLSRTIRDALPPRSPVNGAKPPALYHSC